ncbi:shikimate dehydrogenase family protein [Azospirillum agricola]|uniref:shikimate dehydrogenase family protein n=1 Tax=Azospirillum agricola TaxID=1720247 RepID=UPI000A0F161A|nr:shikimate dehydrogenase [Azospirillum agricola]SMH39871.1 shikimate dehydrogenase [Azospirillum lipoferum]
MQPMLNGATRVFAIVGDPIAQVQSPAHVTRAFAERGENAILVPAHVTPADLDAFLAGIARARNVDGIIVTVPHKFACFRHCTEVTDRARFLGAVNVMRRTADGWAGDMVDGLGFVGGIRAEGFEPEGKSALLVGAGGAGTAIALSLLEAGVRDLAIHDEDTARRDTLVGRLRERFGGAVRAGEPDPAGYDLVANATPAGMRPGDPLPVPVERLERTTFVGCVITAPAASPLVVAARGLGCRTQVGGGMFANLLGLMVDFLLAGKR